MTTIIQHKIEKLTDIIQILEEKTDNKNTYWYRGHSRVNYQLLPSIFRPSRDNEDRYYEESSIIEEMIRRFPRVRKDHNSTIEILTYAQHYGLPTRLLDWSENILVALFFCCNENQDVDGNLYILNTEKVQHYREDGLNDITSLVMTSFEIEVYKLLLKRCKNYHKYFLTALPPKIKNTPYTAFLDKSSVELLIEFASENSVPYEIDLGISHIKPVNVYLYNAPMLNSRLIAQKGCFTIHDGKIINSKEILKVGDMYAMFANNELMKITIPAEIKSRVMRELDLCGINLHTLFPEIEHQVEDIKRASILTTKDAAIS